MAWLSPDFRHLQEGCKWFYWNFRTTNREPLRAIFSHQNYLATHGPAVSYDGGASWRWLGSDATTRQPIGEHGVEVSFEIAPVPPGADVRYAFCPPYLEADFDRWLSRHRNHPLLSITQLCRSRNGRPVELLRIGTDAVERPVIWLMARTHACEAMASYALEGLLEAALGDDRLGQQLRERWEIVATPFMDKDGVEEGDQGKLRHPHDHNRDFNAQPLYPEVAAAMRLGAQSNIAAFLDLHCPMVHGPWDQRLYLVGSPLPIVAAGQDAFMEAFVQIRQGPIHAHGEGVLPFGQAWNTNTNFHAGRCAAIWAGEAFPGARIVASFEVPYANAEGTEVTAATARQLGRDLAAALLAHLNG